jgi:hypothetical protein
MTPLAIDPQALRQLGAAAGIDSVQELARRSGVSAPVIYKALREGRIQPSHVAPLVTILGSDGFVVCEGKPA